MTAPVTPAPAPAAPTVDIADSSALAQMPDEDFASAFGIPKTDTAEAPKATPTEALPLDKGEVTDAEATADGEAAKPAEAEAPLTAEETAQLAQLDASVLPEDKLLTPFKVYDADGELEVPNLEIEFKADGETQKVRLDKVVRLAQLGKYNERREQLVAAAEQAVPLLQREVESHQGALVARDQFLERLLSDPNLYQQAAAAFAEENTPEKQLQRARGELEQVRNQTAAEARNAQLTGFVNTTLAPQMDKVLKDFSSITYDELMGRFYLKTQHMLVNGTLPPERSRDVMRVVEQEILPWAESTHEARGAQMKRGEMTATDAARVLAAQKQRLQLEAQRDKNTLTRGLKPAGKAGADAPPARKVETADEAAEDIINNIAAGLKSA